MRSQFLIPLMSILAISLTAPAAALANSDSQIIRNDDGTLVISLINLDSTKSINEGGIQLQVNFESVGTFGPVNPSISSNVFIDALEVCSKVPTFNDIDGVISAELNLRLTLEEYQRSLGIAPVNCRWIGVHPKKFISANQAKNNFEYPYHENFYKVDTEITRVRVKGSGVTFNMVEDLKSGTSQVVASYKKSLKQLEIFEKNIGKSQRGHLKRLKQSLSNAISKMVDEKGNPKLPVTHDSVREDSRMIMVFSTVLNELLEDFSDVQSVQAQVKSLSALSTQIRDSYGWQSGLAGGSSKAIAALTAVIDLELRELYNTMASFSQANSSVFFNIIKFNNTVGRAVNAKNGGDAAAKVEIAKFVEEWNKAEWQSMIAKLLNAPQDQKGLVQPKMRLLLMAMESLSDLAQVQIIITDTNASGMK